MIVASMSTPRVPATQVRWVRFGESEEHAVRVTAWTFRVLTWIGFAWLIGWRSALVLLAAATIIQGCALVIGQVTPRGTAARLSLAAGMLVPAALLVSTLQPAWPGAIVVAGAGVFLCHAVAYLVDVYRGSARASGHASALAYLIQAPVFPAGPLSRINEFRAAMRRTDVSMSSFAYGVRRIVTGLTKVYLLALPLGATADRIFALRVTKLSTDAAWLGAACVALEVYFAINGFSDIGIGMGRLVGLRYAENFRRPYTADSVREFWRRWNVTLITWLRDYVRLPIAGLDRPGVAGYLITILGFVLVGAWYRPTMHVLPWAAYMGTWLALEALGLGVLLPRLPRVVRHAYVLLVVALGWVLLRASGPGPLLGYVEAMFGASVVPWGGSAPYLTPGLTTALVCALVFAGPLVGNISRWRVSVDAATASLLMMLAATALLLWRWCLVVLRWVLPERPDRSRPAA